MLPTTPRSTAVATSSSTPTDNTNTTTEQQQTTPATPTQDDIVVQSVNPADMDVSETSEFALYQLYKRNFDTDTIDDLSLLKEPADQTVTRILKNRFNNTQPDINGGTSQFYTYLGPTIIAINPYQKSKHYKNHVKT